MKKILLYHVFPVNNWREVTASLISNVPHDDIYVHVSIHHDMPLSENDLVSHLRSFGKVRTIFFSGNSQHAEVDAMEVFRSNIEFKEYSLLTYMHSKGVTKSNSKNINDWIELMRFFIIEKMELCETVFRKGYLLYGVNKTAVSVDDHDFYGASFFYAGNFVSVNLTSDMISKIQSVQLPKTYYGLEGFWGKLCATDLAYNAFHSRVNHYLTPFPENNYKKWTQRIRYSIVSFCYEHYYSLMRLLSAKN